MTNEQFPNEHNKPFEESHSIVDSQISPFVFLFSKKIFN